MDVCERSEIIIPIWQRINDELYQNNKRTCCCIATGHNCDKNENNKNCDGKIHFETTEHFHGSCYTFYLDNNILLFSFVILHFVFLALLAQMLVVSLIIIMKYL